MEKQLSYKHSTKYSLFLAFQTLRLWKDKEPFGPLGYVRTRRQSLRIIQSHVQNTKLYLLSRKGTEAQMELNITKMGFWVLITRRGDHGLA